MNTGPYRSCGCDCHSRPAARLNWRWWVYPPIVGIGVVTLIVAQMPRWGSAEARVKTAAASRNVPSEVRPVDEYIDCMKDYDAREIVTVCVRKWRGTP